MSEREKREINERLAEVAQKFGLKIKLTVKNAEKLIQANYKKVREIESSINGKLKLISKVA
jgi:isopentenyl diphosphate isomerase/L-lactate dehydrogenase-like FMN-dependent dehydrogenase